MSAIVPFLASLVPAGFSAMNWRRRPGMKFVNDRPAIRSERTGHQVFKVALTPYETTKLKDTGHLYVTICSMTPPLFHVEVELEDAMNIANTEFE